MRRRELRRGLGIRSAAIGAAALLLGPAMGFLGTAGAEAQQAGKPARLAILSPFSPLDRAIDGFVAELRRLGWVEGQNLAIETAWAHGRLERMPALATTLANLRPDVNFAPVDGDGIEPAFSTMMAERVEAVVVLVDALMIFHRDRIAELASNRRLPSVFSFKEFAEAGGLLSYGASRDALFRRAAS